MSGRVVASLCIFWCRVVSCRIGLANIRCFMLASIRILPPHNPSIVRRSDCMFVCFRFFPPLLFLPFFFLASLPHLCCFPPLSWSRPDASAYALLLAERISSSIVLRVIVSGGGFDLMSASATRRATLMTVRVAMVSMAVAVTIPSRRVRVF